MRGSRSRTERGCVAGAGAPGATEVYDAGEHLHLAITFSDPVTVTRSGARLAFDFSGGPRSVVAQAVESDRLLFRYAVAVADRDADGVGPGAQRPDAGPGHHGGRLRTQRVGRSGSAALPPRTASMATAPGRRWRSCRSPANGANYRSGETIRVTATSAHAVQVSGALTIRLEVGGVERRAAYAKGSGTATLASPIGGARRARRRRGERAGAQLGPRRRNRLRAWPGGGVPWPRGGAGGGRRHGDRRRRHLGAGRSAQLRGGRSHPRAGASGRG